MQDQDQLDNYIVENEIERIEILFLKRNYNNEQKKWFLESKLMSVKDKSLLEAYKRLMQEINE